MPGLKKIPAQFFFCFFIQLYIPEIVFQRISQFIVKICRIARLVCPEKTVFHVMMPMLNHHQQRCAFFHRTLYVTYVIYQLPIHIMGFVFCQNTFMILFYNKVKQSLQRKCCRYRLFSYNNGSQQLAYINILILPAHLSHQP